MTDLVFKFEPAHLKAYQKLASARAYGEKRGGSWEGEWVRFILCALGVAAGLAVADLSIPALTGRPLAYLELLLGFVAGIGIIVAAMWWRYARSWHRAFRNDGPTMSEHRINLTPDGVRSISLQTDTLYRWAAWDEVTVQGDVIVLWIEPGAGALIPRSAFADHAAENQFVEHIRARIAEAKLPRAGSFP
jgi:hypothetical protein